MVTASGTTAEHRHGCEDPDGRAHEEVQRNFREAGSGNAGGQPQGIGTSYGIVTQVCSFLFTADSHSVIQDERESPWRQDF